jgi:hypothetical protein
LQDEGQGQRFDAGHGCCNAVYRSKLEKASPLQVVPVLLGRLSLEKQHEPDSQQLA